MTLSINSFSRAFNSTHVLEAVGNYDSSNAANAAKLILAVVTAGLGYGVMKLYEFVNARSKMQEFVRHAPTIYQHLRLACEAGQRARQAGAPVGTDASSGASCQIALEHGATLVCTETEHGVRLQLDGHETTLEGATFASLLRKLNTDLIDNVGLYHSQGWQLGGEVESVDLLLKAVAAGIDLTGARFAGQEERDKQCLMKKEDLDTLLATKADLSGICYLAGISSFKELDCLIERGIVVRDCSWEGGVSRPEIVALVKTGINLANLAKIDLSNLDLRGGNFWHADLRGADLRGADLRGADLRGANLQGAYLRGAQLDDAARYRLADTKVDTLEYAHACQILGVSSDATKQEIKMARDRLAREWHPDKVSDGHRQQAVPRMQEINEAYAFLVK